MGKTTVISNKLYAHQNMVLGWKPPGGGIITKGMFTGYGGGKTYLGAIAAFLQACTHYPSPFICVEPTYANIRDFMWPAFEEFLDLHGIKYTYLKNEKNIFIRDKRMGLKGNIQMRSGDNPKSLVGTNSCGAWIDEPFLQPHEVYKRLSARIRKAPGDGYRFILLTGTPEGDTTWAVDVLHDKCEMVATHTVQAKGEDIPINEFASKDGYIRYIETSSHLNESNPDDYIEDLLSRMTTEEAESYVYGRTTNLTTGRCYYAYNEARNLSTECELDYGIPVDISVDFNYGEKWMCWNISQQRAGNVYVRYSLGKPNMNTVDMCQYLEEVLLDYAAKRGKPGQLPAKLIFYGDYGGNSKSSNADRTDYELIEQYFKNKVSFLDVRKKANPLVKRRIQTVNVALCNAHGMTRLFIHPGDDTKILRNDFKHVAWDANRAVEDQSNPKLTHSSSALGYYISYIMPIETIKARRS